MHATPSAANSLLPHFFRSIDIPNRHVYGPVAIVAVGQGFGPGTVMSAGSRKDKPPHTPTPPAPLREQARAWLVQLAAGDMEPREQARLQEWLRASADHKAAFAYEQAMWRQADTLKDMLGPSTWAAVEPDSAAATAKATASSRPKHRSALMRRGSYAALGLAASLLLVLFAKDIWLSLTADHRTTTGEQLQVALPDGSLALLNTDSAIDVDYSSRERRIELLRGEAYFSVAENADVPFVVHSHDRWTRAVGTAFAVRDDSGQVSVTVTDGKVEVSKAQAAITQGPTKDAVRVDADHQITYRDGGGVSLVRTVDTDAALAWRDGRIVIDAMPFGQAIAELDRYRPGRIVIATLSATNAPVSGVFSSRSLDSAIGTLAATQGLSVQHLTPYLVILH